MGWLSVMARLEPGKSQQQAQAELAVWLSQVQSDQGELGRNARRLRNVEIVSGSKGLSETRNKFSKQLWILMTVVGLLLLIACANVANLCSCERLRVPGRLLFAWQSAPDVGD